MIEVIEAPSEPLHIRRCPSIFLAGGITNCPDWQQSFIANMQDTVPDLDLTIFNPRRYNFPMTDPYAAEGQIKWEHKFIRVVDAVVFWFPKETLCPITLFELGSRLEANNQELFIGTHNGYERIADVLIQSKLQGHHYEIYHGPSEFGMIDMVIDWANGIY